MWHVMCVMKSQLNVWFCGNAGGKCIHTAFHRIFINLLVETKFQLVFRLTGVRGKALYLITQRNDYEKAHIFISFSTGNKYFN